MEKSQYLELVTMDTHKRLLYSNILQIVRIQPILKPIDKDLQKRAGGVRLARKTDLTEICSSPPGKLYF